MILYPNAKINLGLAVMRKRADGYHDLETIFLPVTELHDELEVLPLPAASEQAYTFEQEGITVDGSPEDNLIIRAYLAMRDRYPQVGPVAIRFRKRIPFGAGLGGGSADAAYMVKAVNTLFSLGLTDEEMEAIVSPLGADCAFFIQNRPRFAEGIGNIFSEVPEEVLEQIRGKWIVLVKPSCAVSTAQAYRGIQRREEQGEMGIRDVHELSQLTNDFERTVFPLFPEIAAVKQQLEQLGACYAAMSGSGATVFGLFDSQTSLQEALTRTGIDALKALFPNCFIHQQQL